MGIIKNYILAVCVTDSVRKVIANSKKRKKKGDDNPIRLFYCNNILHAYIHTLYS